MPAKKNDKPKQDPKNFRFHGERNKELIGNSIDELGLGRSILLDNEDFAIAGNGVLEQAEARGIPIEIIESDGTKLFAIKRTDLGPDDPKRRKLALADNATTDSSDWDTTVLQENWTTEELEEWDIDLSEFEEEEIEPEEDDFNQPLPTHAKTVLGDLYELHSIDKGLVHRVQCGDSTEVDVVGRLMNGKYANCVLTDPPYGINQPGVPGDTPEENVELMNGVTSILPIQNAVIVAFNSTRTFPNWLNACNDAGYKFERMLWLYKKAQNSYPWRGWLLTSEAILVSRLGEGQWNDVHPYTHDTYEVSEVSGELPEDIGWHGSVKPIAIVHDLLSRISESKGIVYDPFLGSGTTLIAAEQLERNCYGQELDEKYMDIIVKRWAKYMADNDLEFKILRNGEDITEEEWILEIKEA